MDHLDIRTGLPNEHAINYSVPRIRFVCQKDFNLVDKVDKNHTTLTLAFYGKHTQVSFAIHLSPLFLTFFVFFSFEMHVAILLLFFVSLQLMSSGLENIP